MSNATPHFEPLALVDSFYGPGTFSGWVLTVISVAVTWAFNVDPQQDDKISVDFILVLAFPCAAAGHFIRLLATMSDEVDLYQHSGYPNLNSTSSNSTSSNSTSSNSTTIASAALAQYIAAAEAPLRICRSFTPIYFCFFQIAQSRRHTRRRGYAVLAGLFVYIAKLPVFVRSAGERPGVFSGFNPIIYWGFFEPMYLLYGARPWLNIWASSWPSVVSKRLTGELKQNVQNLREGDEGRREGRREGRNTREGPRLKAPPKPDFQAAANQDQTVTVLIISVAVALVYMATPAKPGNGFLDLSSNFGPVPRSSNGILEMDQFAAFASGCLIVLFSIREAILSRRAAALHEPDVEADAEGLTGKSEPADEVATGLGIREDADQLVLQRQNGGQGGDDGDISLAPLYPLD